MFTRLGHQPVILRGRRRVDPAGLAGSHEQGLPQTGIATFGGAAVAAGQPGGVEDRDRPGEGLSTGQGSEPIRIAEPAQDRACCDRGDAWSGGEDAGRISCSQQQSSALVELFDLLGELQREPGLDRDVLGQVGIVQLAFGPQLEGLVGGGEQRVGPAVRPQAPRECR